MPRVPRILIALSAAAYALAGATAAQADHGQPLADRNLTSYLEVAAAHWGAPAPSCTGPDGQTIPTHVALYDDPDPDVAAAAEQPGCRIWLDRDWWPAPASRIACTIIAHEWGHLLGFGHSEDRRHLMYGRPLSGAPGCWLFEARVAVGRAVAHSSSPGRRRTRRRGARRAGRPLRASRKLWRGGRLVPEHRVRRGRAPRA